MSLVTRENDVLKLVFPGGYIERHKTRVIAAEVMKKNPRHCITRPDVFVFPWIVVKPESVLMPGSVFFIVPFHTIHRLLQSKCINVLKNPAPIYKHNHSNHVEHARKYRIHPPTSHDLRGFPKRGNIHHHIENSREINMLTLRSVSIQTGSDSMFHKEHNKSEVNFVSLDRCNLMKNQKLYRKVSIQSCMKLQARSDGREEAKERECSDYFVKERNAIPRQNGCYDHGGTRMHGLRLQNDNVGLYVSRAVENGKLKPCLKEEKSNIGKPLGLKVRFDIPD